MKTTAFLGMAALATVLVLGARQQPAAAGPAPALLMATAAASAAAPPAFATCKVCHSVEKGGAAKIGPNLFGIVGAKAGTRPGYAYSGALKGSGLTWTQANLDAYLAGPAKLVPGTKMAVPGNANADSRKAIVDYLASLK